MTADVARRFLDSLAAQDFEALAADLSDDVRLRALLPGDTKEWEGPDRVKATFIRWFGNTLGFELIDRAVDDLGPRLHMSWQARVRADRLGDGWFRVEQQAYADTDEHDRIEHLWLACSGYLAEAPAR
jgi:ketosteroid isomerase-like protein